MIFILPVFLHMVSCNLPLTLTSFLLSPNSYSHKLVKSLLLRDVTELGEVLVPLFDNVFL